jgi:hypothetical protein
MEREIFVEPEQILRTRIKEKGHDILLLKKRHFWWNGEDIFSMMPLRKGGITPWEFPKFKGIENNTQFLNGGQCNNPLKKWQGIGQKHNWNAIEC